MLASAPQFPPPVNPAIAPPRSEVGFTSGGVRMLLRLEGAAALAAALGLYGHAGFSWPIFAALVPFPGPVDARLSRRAARGRRRL